MGAGNWVCSLHSSQGCNTEELGLLIVVCAEAVVVQVCRGVLQWVQLWLQLLFDHAHAGCLVGAQARATATALLVACCAASTAMGVVVWCA
mgnify:CR=1 FL=1